MEQISLLEAYKFTKEYKKMLPKERVQLRKRRMFELLNFARANSPLYKELYKGIKGNFTIKDLPTVSKDTLLSNYDSWSTDSAVTFADMSAHLETGSSKEYLDRYSIVSSGGSEGNPLLHLYDDNCGRVMSIAYASRIFSRREYFWKFLFKGGRIASIYSENEIFFENVFASMRKKHLPFREDKSITLKAQSGTEDLSVALNSFAPAILAGFPSVLVRLADAKRSGALKIAPVFIVADGESLEKEVREQISSAFGCDVISSYSSAISGCIAYECREHHLHLNDDWLIVEAVDNMGNTVPSGKPSDKVLITNLLNYTQPIIRYELGDRIVVHDKPCLCGNVSPWIEIMGRTLDQIRFVVGPREIIVPIADLDAVLKGEDYLDRYQIIVNPNNHLELRLTGAGDTDKTMAFFKAERKLRSYMRSIGILAPMITLDKEDPKPHPVSGKYQTVIIP